MPRPRIDNQAVRETLLLAAEKRLRMLGSPRFSVTDIASDCNMSQSNVYRFFPNKAAMMAALVERWFMAIEAELLAAVNGAQTWQEKLRQYVLVQLTLKTSIYDQDPVLFRANLVLADEHMEPVRDHVSKLHSILDGILEKAFDGEELVQAMKLFVDTTQIFRDPYFISRLRLRCTPERAEEVLKVVICELEQRQRPTAQ
jgi:AcrR family transcriptional regulator